MHRGAPESYDRSCYYRLTVNTSDTTAELLRKALELTREVGLERLSTALLAERLTLPRTMVVAHLGSREQLQCRVLDAAAAEFVEAVKAPAIARPRGLPRVEALFDRWLVWEHKELERGRLLSADGKAFYERARPVRDRILGYLQQALETIAFAARIAVEVGDFRSDLDVEQFAYEFWVILLAYQKALLVLERTDARRRARRSFAGLVRSARSTRERKSA